MGRDARLSASSFRACGKASARRTSVNDSQTVSSGSAIRKTTCAPGVVHAQALMVPPATAMAMPATITATAVRRKRRDDDMRHVNRRRFTASTARGSPHSG